MTEFFKIKIKEGICTLTAGCSTEMFTEVLLFNDERLKTI